MKPGQVWFLFILGFMAIFVLFIWKSMHVPIRVIKLPQYTNLFHVSNVNFKLRYDMKNLFFLSEDPCYTYIKRTGVLRMHHYLSGCKDGSHSPPNTPCINKQLFSFTTLNPLYFLETSSEMIGKFLPSEVPDDLDGYVCTGRNDIGTLSRVFIMKMRPGRVKYSKITHPLMSNQALMQECNLNHSLTTSIYRSGEYVNLRFLFDIPEFLSLRHTVLSYPTKFLYIKNQTVYPFYDKKTEVRFCSYNVHNWKDCFNNPNVESIVFTILKMDADVLCLQEASSYFESLYESHFKILYPFVSFHHHLVTLSKWPVIGYEVIHLGRDPIRFTARYALLSVIQVRKDHSSALHIHVCNTHLDAFDHTESTRDYEIDIIKKRFELLQQQRQLGILLGDLNSIHPQDYSKEWWEQYICNKKNSKYVPQQFQVIPKLCKFLWDTQILTNSTQKKDLYTCWSLKRVDYIFVNQRLCVRHSIITDPSSDHFPVCTDISFSNFPS